MASQKAKNNNRTQQQQQMDEWRATKQFAALIADYPNVLVSPINADEAKIIRSSFIRIADKLEEIGASAFAELFQNHPESMSIFVKRSVFPETLAEVKYSWELKAHAMRVMHTLEKVVNRLDKPATVWSQLLADIGCRHAQYNAKPAFLPVLVAAFRHSFFNEFTNKGLMTPEVSRVWYKFFNNMIVVMTSATVASYCDSMMEYKEDPSKVPPWVKYAIASPKKTSPTNTSTPVSPSSPKCPMAQQQQQQRQAVVTQPRSPKQPQQQPQAGATTPVKSPTGSSSSGKRPPHSERRKSSIKQRFQAVFAPASRTRSNDSSASDDVQIVNI